MTRQEYLELIHKAKTEPVANGLSPLAPVLAAYMEQFMPGDSDENAVSAEIAEELAPLCQMTTNEVAEVMVFLGYTLVFNAYGVAEWGIDLYGND